MLHSAPQNPSSRRLRPAAALLGPSAVTIVGASPRSGPTRELLRNLRRADLPFPGPIMPVNPTRSEIDGLPCWPSVGDLQGAPGLVYLMVGSQHCMPVLEQLGPGTEGVVIYASGFKESGNADGEAALSRWSALTGIPLLGPQSLGAICSATSFAGFAAPLPETVRPGSIGLAFQSGGLVSGTLRGIFQRGLGLACAISYGNAAGIGAREACEACLDREEVRVIALHTEGGLSVRDLHSIAVAAQRKGKPFVLLLSGTSEAGQRTALSHTGALATSPNILKGVARQFGVIVVEDVDQMVWACEAFDQSKCRRAHPGRVGIMSMSGGSAVVMADAAERAGLELHPPGPIADEALDDGSGHRAHNPHDLGALVLDDAASLGARVRKYATDPTFGIVTMLSGVGLPRPDLPRHLAIADAFISAVKHADKLPVVATPITQDTNGVARWPGVVLAAGVLETTVKLKALCTWGQFDGAAWPDVDSADNTQTRDGEGELVPDEEVQSLLADLPVAWPAAIEATTSADAAGATRRVGVPLVMKTAARLPHKLTLGGVILNIDSETAARSAAEYMIGRFSAPVVLSAQIDHGFEYLLGFRRDADHGPLIVFGAGGSRIGSVHFRLAPLSGGDIDRLAETYGDARLVPILTAFNDIVSRDTRIKTADINPFAFAADGRPYVLDAKVYT